MSATSDPPAQATAWPAARPAGINPIQHPAWEEARNAILDLVAEGPVTIVVVGQPGTGKTWLLRELASSLGDHGFPTMMLMQGDLPLSLSPGAALLVDNAGVMTPSTWAELAAQEHGVAILAAADWPHEDEASPRPVLIPLRPLKLEESVGFAAQWLQAAGLSASSLNPDALFRLAEESQGVVGTLVPALAESVTAWREPAIPAVEEPHTPGLTLADLIADASATQPLEPAPRRRKLYRPLLVGSAIAAMLVLGWLAMPVAPPARTASSPVPPAPVVAEQAPAAPPSLPPPQQAETATPAQPTPSEATAAALPMPPIGHADTSAPALATVAAPARPDPPSPPLAAPSPPDLDTADIPVETHTPAPSAAIASAPPVLIPADPALVATFEDPDATPIPAPRKLSQFDRTGSPGLVLIAQPGDTLESLYGSVYRDRNAPPFATVLAANPGRFRPGGIVVFPEPPGGWRRVQR